MNDSIVDRLTAAGAPFEFADIEVRGVPCRVFKDTLPYLSMLYRGLPAFANRTMIVYEQRRLSFAEACSGAATLAEALRKEHGIGAGSRVGIVMRNCPEWIVSFLAVTSLGGVAVLVNSRGTADETAYCLGSTRCELALVDRRCAAGLEDTAAAAIPLLVTDVPETSEPGGGSLDRILATAGEGALGETACDPEDTALILFTSGTTGRPKGALLTHRGVMTALKTVQFSSALIGAQMAARYGIDLETLAANMPQPCTLLMFPLFHVSGCHAVLLPALTQGGKVVLMKRWNAETALGLVESEKITTFPGVPAMHWDLLQVPDREKYDLTSISSMSVGGQATPLPLLEAIKEAFPNAVLGTGYGMTETNGAVALTVGDEFLATPTSTGRPLATTEVRLLGDDGEWAGEGKEGEICVRGATVMSGYDAHPEANAESFMDGWLKTGDVGYFDEDNRLHIVDRKTDMVISGGENIYCAEVERVLLQHPAVQEAATFGVTDDRLGEKLIAVIRLRTGARASADEVTEFAARHLALYKVPKDTVVQSEPLPANPSGKILKTKLREKYLAGGGDS